MKRFVINAPLAVIIIVCTDTLIFTVCSMQRSQLKTFAAPNLSPSLQQMKALSVGEGRIIQQQAESKGSE